MRFEGATCEVDHIGIGVVVSCGRIIALGCYIGHGRFVCVV